MATGNNNSFDVIIVGGSYSGLAAAMGLGRALRHVLVIDSGLPCNRQTPHSHNFLTQDGNTPAEIAALARQQVEAYPTVKFMRAVATRGRKKENGFEIEADSGEKFLATKLIFATGIRDIMPDLQGFAECWGISVIHCPYCHGYEVRNEKTGILANGEAGYDYCALISNWTRDLTLFTNGPAILTSEQISKLERHKIEIVETEVRKIEHTNGHIRSIVFKDGRRFELAALYCRPAFQQHCAIPETLGCEMTEDGYIKTDVLQKTSVPGIYACGDNSVRMRSVAMAISAGTIAATTVNKEMILEAF
ncbi:MAG TPA: NAD(P)/FAD-dependent oxidoreductase [Chryseosolibacter sp.]|nr:NAD(P)/FAD-dependent oxidoreductase [Chryseosolibacter sp.]